MRKVKTKTSIIFIMINLIIAMTPTQAINWGNPDPDGLYSEVGAIMIPYGEEILPFCSGTLINDDPVVFLSAGHCTDYLEFLIYTGNLEMSDIFVTFDFDPTLPRTKMFEISEIVTHPEYNPNTVANDLGILLVNIKPTKLRITPAKLAQEDFLEQLLEEKQLMPRRTPFAVVGYGGTLDFPPPDIYYPDMRYYAEAIYQTLLPSSLKLSQNYLQKYGGTCFGDSGGPVFWEAADERTLVAITSWGDAWCIEPGFYWRVDIPSSLGFIQQFL
jgi:hypothetical protein